MTAGERIKGSIGVRGPGKTRGKLALALTLEHGTVRQRYWSYIDGELGGRVTFDFGALELDGVPVTGVIVAQVVLCQERESISNRVPVLLVVSPTPPRHEASDHASLYPPADGGAR